MAKFTNINEPAIQQSVRASLIAVLVVLPTACILDILNLGWSVFRFGLHAGGFCFAGGLLLIQRQLPLSRLLVCSLITFYFAILAAFALGSGILYSTTSLWAVAVTSFGALVVGTRFSIGCVVAYAAVLVAAAIQQPNPKHLEGFEQLFSFVVDFLGSLSLTMYIAFIHEKTHTEQLRQLADQGLELENARAAAISTAQISALGEMAGGIAHEINNPLTIIDGRLRQLQMIVKARSEPDAEILGVTDKMLATVQRIAIVIRGLKTFSRHDAHPVIGPMLVQKIVSDILDLVGEKIRIRGIHLELDVDPDVRVVAAEVPVGQVLINLLNNALFAVREVSAAHIGIHAHVSGENVFIRIVDNGPGVPAHVLPRLFQPFTTSKPIGEGTGIGLSISLGIAKTYGGDLTHEWKEGKTCFVLRLPVG